MSYPWMVMLHGNMISAWHTEREAIEDVILLWYQNDCNWDGFETVFVMGPEVEDGWDPDDGYLEHRGW